MTKALNAARNPRGLEFLNKSGSGEIIAGKRMLLLSRRILGARSRPVHDMGTKILTGF